MRIVYAQTAGSDNIKIAGKMDVFLLYSIISAEP